MRETELTILRQAYLRGENITQLLRKRRGCSDGVNDQRSVLVAYDMQAGSYVAELQEAGFLSKAKPYWQRIATELAALKPLSVLEAGVGEATTLAAVASQLSCPSWSAFDLAWSRVHVAGQHLANHDLRLDRLFVGELEAIALPDSSVDVIYTSHAVEPNFGREEQILAELFRVCQRYVVLFEPAYELASPEARARMEQFGYCRGLATAAQKAGFTVVKQEMLPERTSQLNPTAILLLQKPASDHLTPSYICPNCGAVLQQLDNHWFCAEEGLVFPELRGIPCLTRNHAIVASLYGKANPIT